MKLIGRTETGNAIVEIEYAWIAALKDAIASLETVTAPAAIAAAGPVVRQKRPMCSKPSGKEKTCAVCGKTFKPKTSEVTCSIECRKAREQAQKKTYSKPAAPANPKAARLDMIRKLNQRLDAVPRGPDSFSAPDPNED